MDAPILSTGQPSTLAVWRANAAMMFGEDSAAVEFLDWKIASDPDGKDAVVIAAESQMLLLLMDLTANKTKTKDESENE